MFGDLDKNTKQFPNRKLNEISAYWNGLTYKPADAVEAGSGTLVLRSSNIQDGSLAFDDNVYVGCTIKEKLFVQDNDILMCSRNGSAALVGKTALIKGLTEPTTFGAFMMIIRSDYYSYLKTYFETPFFRNKISTGTSTINQITGKMLNEISLPVPDMDTVRRFEEFTHQSDKSKFVRFKSQFIEMFGDPYTNPKGWEIGTIEDVMIGKASNGFFAKPADYSSDGNAGIICVGDVVNRKYSNVTGLRRANADDKQFQKFKVQYGDMLFCRSSLVKEGIAKASIVPAECDEDILFECHVIRVRLDIDRVVPEFMQAFTITDYFRTQMMDKSKTATMTTIGQKDVISGGIYIPDMELQKQFAEFAEQSDKSK